MKVLMLFSGQDSLSKSFYKGFKDIFCNVKIVNFQDFNGQFKNSLYEISILFPTKYRRIIEKEYLYSIQKKYLEEVQNEQPDLVLIYNDQMITSTTVKEIRKTAKVGVYLADSPFFLERREHILPMLFEADHIFAPDTFWIEQLKSVGLSKATFLIGPYHIEDDQPVIISEAERIRFTSDLFYLGSPYRDSWGYKRALFLSKFTFADIKIYGPKEWNYWFKYFPDLERKMVLGDRISFSTLKKMMHCCKLYPIDANPGLINGLHIRIFDSIASGLLPIIEYKKDLPNAFPGIDIPAIKTYNEIPSIIQQWLEDDGRRIRLVSELQAYLKEKYRADKVVSKLMDKIY